MRRFWIQPDQIHGETIQISGELFHHIRDVCRFEVGGHFEVLPGDGRALYVEVIEVKKKSLSARVLEERRIDPLPQPLIHLFVSLPKFSTFETVLEKSVELGVAQITPVFSDFSFIRTQDKLSDSRWQRWGKIIRSASQQCGRGHLLQLNVAKKIEEILKSINQQTKVVGLFPYEGGGRLTLKASLKSLDKSEVNEIWVFVGSEGGFSPREVELFQSHGLEPVTMGDQILRVETACLALVSIIKYEFEAMG